MRLHIRWSKVSIVAIAMAAVLSVAFIAPLVIDQMRDHRAAQLHPHPANDAQQVEILRGVLKEGFFTSWRLPPRPPDAFFGPSGPSLEMLNGTASLDDEESIVLIGSSPVTCEKSAAVDKVEFGCISVSDRERDDSFVQDEPGIPRKLLQELFAANRVPSILPDMHSLVIHYWPQAAMERLISSPDRWNRFYALFPHSYAIEVSRAVLSEDGTHALIHVQLRFVPRGEQGVLYYLIHTGDIWRVEKASGPEII